MNVNQSCQVCNASLGRFAVLQALFIVIHDQLLGWARTLHSHCRAISITAPCLVFTHISTHQSKSPSICHIPYSFVVSRSCLGFRFSVQRTLRPMVHRLFGRFRTSQRYSNPPSELRTATCITEILVKQNRTLGPRNQLSTIYYLPEFRNQGSLERG